MRFTAAVVVIGLFGTVKSEYQSESHGAGFSGLSLIAQGSANEAHFAVSNQHAAAEQASYVARNALAQQAVQAAETAQAALTGKHVILEALEKQREDAREEIKGELAQVKMAKKSASAAAKTADHAVQYAELVQKAYNGARDLAQQTESASGHADQELSTQSLMVAEAKAKLQEVEYNLDEALANFEEAMTAAQEAADMAEKAINRVAHSIDYSHSDFFGLREVHESLIY